MNDLERKGILKKAKIFFKNSIILKHVAKLSSLSKLSRYDYNPYLVKYLAILLSGKYRFDSIAKVLLYPRVLGTSISTSFGSNIQKFISTVLGKYGSSTLGIDIEFIDKKDGRKKYCQLKSGPETINKDDVVTISNHFNTIRNLAKTNNLDLRVNDLVVGVLYGNKSDLSTFYKTLQKTYEVIPGQEFWERLTGDKLFYKDLINAFAEVTSTAGGHKKLKQTLKDLATNIKESGVFV